MYLFQLAEKVRDVVEALKSRLGEFRLAMLYNLDVDALEFDCVCSLVR